VSVINSETNEVIRQMPSEEAVAAARALDKMQGVIIHQKA
jgi:flagellar protein FlaG